MIHVPNTVIKTKDQLEYYLQIALKLEHATIPPYLTAAYSATVEENQESRNIILKVAREEMLHLTLVANLLNSIGGKPNLARKDFVPNYPTYLPTGQDDFKVGIERFSQYAIETFLKIERPTPSELGQQDVVHHIKKTITLEGDNIDESMVNRKNSFVPIKKVGDNRYNLDYSIAVVPHYHLTIPGH